MILEGLVTTTNPDGSPHLTPMGPTVQPDMTRFVLRPFPTSRTYRNLLQHGEGVFHVTDDALLLAKAAVGAIDTAPPLRPAEFVKGFVMPSACRFYEFAVTDVDATEERVKIDVRVIHKGTLRDFVGFNRAKHAILEAAILATRLHLVPLAEVAAEFRKLRTIVEKTGGPAEFEAMAFLTGYLTRAPTGGGAVT
jgi:hypothetical protein